MYLTDSLAHIGTPGFYCASLYCASQRLHFLQMEGCGNPASRKSISATFSNGICSLHLSLSHFGNFYNISNFFTIIIFVMVICDQ